MWYKQKKIQHSNAVDNALNFKFNYRSIHSNIKLTLRFGRTQMFSVSGNKYGTPKLLTSHLKSHPPRTRIIRYLQTQVPFYNTVIIYAYKQPPSADDDDNFTKQKSVKNRDYVCTRGMTL